jgi:hypothetical protein
MGALTLSSSASWVLHTYRFGNSSLAVPVSNVSPALYSFSSSDVGHARRSNKHIRVHTLARK